MKVDIPPLSYPDATSLVHINGSSEAKAGSLQNPEIIKKGQNLMTAFGLWLAEQGYDEHYVDTYSDPDVTEQRLRALDPSHFVLDGAEITAVPISYFTDTIGEDPSMATDRTRELYQRREESLQRQLVNLAIVSADAREDPQANAAGLRQRVVESINQHASHDDGQKKVVNGKHFSAASTAILAGRSDKYWLQRLLVAQDQAHHGLGDAVVTRDDRLLKGRKTTLADKFIHDTLVQERTRPELLNILSGSDGYVVTAQLLFHGDMLKAYMNISAVAAMTGQAVPEGWQAFHGSTVNFATIRDEVLAQAQPGIAGYLAIADTAAFGGNMKKAYMNISAVVAMTRQTMPEGWQQFHGSTAELRAQAEWLNENSSAEPKKYQAHFYPTEKPTSGDGRVKSQLNLAVVRRYVAERQATQASAQ